MTLKQKILLVFAKGKGGRVSILNRASKLVGEECKIVLNQISSQVTEINEHWQ